MRSTRRARLLAAGDLAALPVDDRDLLLLAGSERQAVEQVADRVAVGHPLLLEPQQVPVRDRGRLRRGEVAVPLDRVVGVEAPASGFARHGTAEEPVQVGVQREPRGAGDPVGGHRTRVAGEVRQDGRVDREVGGQCGRDGVGAERVPGGATVVGVIGVAPDELAGAADPGLAHARQGCADRGRVPHAPDHGCLLDQAGQELVDDVAGHLARRFQGQSADLRLGGADDVGEGVLLQRPVRLGEVDAAPGAGVGGEGAVRAGQVFPVRGTGRLGAVLAGAVASSSSPSRGGRSRG